MDNGFITALFRRHAQDRSNDPQNERAKRFTADVRLICQHCTAYDDVVLLIRECFGTHEDRTRLLYCLSNPWHHRYMNLLARGLPVQHLWQFLLQTPPVNFGTIGDDNPDHDASCAQLLVALALVTELLVRQRILPTTTIQTAIRERVQPLLRAPHEAIDTDARFLAVAVAYVSGLDRLVDEAAAEHASTYSWRLPIDLTPNDWRYYPLEFGRQTYCIDDLPALRAIYHGAAAVESIGQWVNQQALLPHIYLRALQLAGLPPTAEQLTVLESWYDLDHPVWTVGGRIRQRGGDHKPWCQFIHQLFSSPVEVRTANLFRFLTFQLLPNIRRVENETYGGLVADDYLPKDVPALPLLFPLEWRKPLAMALLNGLQASNSIGTLSNRNEVLVRFVSRCYRNQDQEQRAQDEDAAELAWYFPETDPTKNEDEFRW